jgi:hypothetical protein
MEFRGFQEEAFQFFADLGENNTVEWFSENEPRFEEHVKQPMADLVKEMSSFFASLNPDLATLDPPNEHFSHMRTSGGGPADSPPFKTTFYSFFWNTEIPRLSDAWFYVGVSAEGVGLGFSIYDFGRNRRTRLASVFKPRLASDLQLLDDYIKAAYLRRGFQFKRFARAPGRIGLREVDPFPTRPAEWSNTLGWVVSRHIHTESSRLTPGSFVSEAQDTFTRLYPLYTFCSDPRPDWKRKFKAAS